LVLVFVVSAVKVPLVYVNGNTPIEGQYIVVFKTETTSQQRDEHMKELSVKFESKDEIIDRYEMGTFFGYAAKLSSALLEEERNSVLVDYIEVDSIVHATQSCTQQNDATWGINRVSEQQLNLNGIYKYSYDGQNVDSYIVDTGILTTHVEFEGRAVFGVNYAGGSNADCNGHGTHVAGTVGSKSYGVAKKTTLIAVKVLDCNGSGTNSGVISGIQWVQSSYQGKSNPAVANMSLGGGKSSSLDNAVRAAILSGVTFAVAAGNENQDACNVSPGGVLTAISAGATGTDDDGNWGEEDIRASFSNWGSCVSILAPGVLITSTWIGSNTAIETISGTSMASPHVAGAAACYLSENPDDTPAQVKAALLNTASSGLVDLNCAGNCASKTPNLLLYKSC